ncbi:MAG: hypothetical protein LBI49_20000 [Nocardiopsaceae bacterium]|nr:hypothetical protein [Nocardiopsaceae bacterium]
MSGSADLGALVSRIEHDLQEYRSRIETIMSEAEKILSEPLPPVPLPPGLEHEAQQALAWVKAEIRAKLNELRDAACKLIGYVQDVLAAAQLPLVISDMREGWGGKVSKKLGGISRELENFLSQSQNDPEKWAGVAGIKSAQAVTSQQQAAGFAEQQAGAMADTCDSFHGASVTFLEAVAAAMAGELVMIAVGAIIGAIVGAVATAPAAGAGAAPGGAAGAMIATAAGAAAACCVTIAAAAVAYNNGIQQAIGAFHGIPDANSDVYPWPRATTN